MIQRDGKRLNYKPCEVNRSTIWPTAKCIICWRGVIIWKVLLKKILLAFPFYLDFLDGDTMFRNLHKVGDIFLDENRDLSPLIGSHSPPDYLLIPYRVNFLNKQDHLLMPTRRKRRKYTTLKANPSQFPLLIIFVSAIEPLLWWLVTEHLPRELASTLKAIYLEGWVAFYSINCLS